MEESFPALRDNATKYGKPDLSVMLSKNDLHQKGEMGNLTKRNLI